MLLQSKLSDSQKKKLLRWIQPGEKEVHGYIYKRPDGSFWLRRVEFKRGLGGLSKHAWATFHTHPNQCDPLSHNKCFLSTPSTLDMDSYWKMASKGLQRHFIFLPDKTYYLECRPCGQASVHLRQLERVTAKTTKTNIVTQERDIVNLIRSWRCCRLTVYRGPIVAA